MNEILDLNSPQASCFRRIVLRARPLPPILPPLGVLMMFHSFMLNLPVFLEDCIRLGNYCSMIQWRRQLLVLAVRSELSGAYTNNSDFDPGKPSETSRVLLINLSTSPVAPALRNRLAISSHTEVSG
jgi:hypothetical protein